METINLTHEEIKGITCGEIAERIVSAHKNSNSKVIDLSLPNTIPSLKTFDSKKNNNIINILKKKGLEITANWGKPLPKNVVRFNFTSSH